MGRSGQVGTKHCRVSPANPCTIQLKKHSWKWNPPPGCLTENRLSRAIFHMCGGRVSLHHSNCDHHMFAGRRFALRVELITTCVRPRERPHRAHHALWQSKGLPTTGSSDHAATGQARAAPKGPSMVFMVRFHSGWEVSIETLV